MSCRLCRWEGETSAKNDGDGDGDNDEEEGRHFSSPSLPSLPSRKMMGRKGKRNVVIWRANASAAGDREGERLRALGPDRH
jgi:hypothetical protein